MKNNNADWSLDHTFYSDGTRQITVSYKSYEGEREVLQDIKDLLRAHFEAKDIVICGCCYFDHGKDAVCPPYDRWEYAPLKIRTNKWHKTESGRWEHND